MEVAACTASFATLARLVLGVWEASLDPTGYSVEDLLDGYDPHAMTRGEAFELMKAMEQNRLLPPGRSALDMTAFHRPGENAWSMDPEIRFDVVAAVRENYAYVTRTASVDASTLAFVKAQFDVWNDLAALAGKGRNPAAFEAPF